MAHTRNGNYIGRAAQAEKKDWLSSLAPDTTPDYASIIIKTFGREFALKVYMSGWEYFKRVSVWLSRLDEHERETAGVMVGLGGDLDKVMQAIECDHMTADVKETYASL